MRSGDTCEVRIAHFLVKIHRLSERRRTTSYAVVCAEHLVAAAFQLGSSSLQPVSATNHAVGFSSERDGANTWYAMKFVSTYSIKIQTNQHKKVFIDTVKLYRQAVDFFIHVRLQEDALFCDLDNNYERLRRMEAITVTTKRRTSVKYDFCSVFYKFPSYYRRAAINEAMGKVDSYQKNLRSWEEHGKQQGMPSLPSAGYAFPSLYWKNCYVRTDRLSAKLKVYIRNTWDWVGVSLRNTDVSYIEHHCSGRDECCPTLQRRGKNWYLDFPFKEKTRLADIPLSEQIVLAVDLGISNACTCTAMKSDGTILGRRFLSLPREQDSLVHAVNRIKKAQQHGAKRMPRLWARAKGVNNHIAVETAAFIVNTAVRYSAFTIVFEHLERTGKKSGSKKWRLHFWKSQYVQSMVADKAHRLHIHVVHVNAWGTSRLAFDGSGRVQRGREANLDSYSLCRFQNGKVYNCDLNASYNIGARYFIREQLKSLPETERLAIEAKVPQCTKRSTCTLSTLINLNAVLAA